MLSGEPLNQRQANRALISHQGYTSLNRIQSVVYPTAYGTNENMLICGKALFSDQKSV